MNARYQNVFHPSILPILVLELWYSDENDYKPFSQEWTTHKSPLGVGNGCYTWILGYKCNLATLFFNTKPIFKFVYTWLDHPVYTLVNQMGFKPCIQYLFGIIILMFLMILREPTTPLRAGIIRFVLF